MKRSIILHGHDANLTSKPSERHRTSMMVLRIHPWVRWWFYLGVICGAVALFNIFFRDLTRTEEKVILFFGVVFWLLGGLVCWAWEGVTLEKPPEQRETKTAKGPVETPNVASEFIVRDSNPQRRTLRQSRLLALYLLRHWEKHRHA